MWRSKKFVIALVATVVLVGSVTGVVLAQNGGDSQPEAKHRALLDRVCEIYEENTGVAINSEALKDAFAQAQSEMREAALESRLEYLVDQGKITRDGADQYLEWWQARPDVPLRFGFRGHGGFRGIGGPLAWGGLCVPAE